MKPLPEGDESLPADVQSIDRLLKAIFLGNRAKADESPVNSSEKKSTLSSSGLSGSELDLEWVMLPGQTLGPFWIHNVLGIGGYGIVYRATETERKQEVALKLPREDRGFSQFSYQRFQREPRLLNRLDHECIVKLVDQGVIDNRFYIATEYQDGLDLHQWMPKNRNKINEKLVIDWGMKLADALEHAFQNGLVHRDLKPRNIIIVKKSASASENAENEAEVIPKITDFGLAFSFQEAFSGSTDSGAIVGTLGYLPHELVMGGSKRADIRGDIYALGIILAEIAQGRSLRKPDNLVDYIMQFNQNGETVNIRVIKKIISPGLYSILKKCVSANPQRRYQTPRDLYLDLERLKNGIPLEVKLSNSRENLRRIVRRYPLISISVLISMLFLSVISLVQLWNQIRLTRSNEELKFANGQIQKQLDALSLANDSIRKSQEDLKRTNYNSAIRLGFSEMRENRLESVHDILDKTYQMEKEGVPGLRELSWKYLNHIASKEYQTHKIRDFEFYLPYFSSPNLKDQYDAYLRACDKYHFGFGYVNFYQDEISFYYDNLFSRLNEKRITVFHQALNPKRWYLLENDRLDVLDESGKYEHVLFNRKADMFYFFEKNVAENQKNSQQIISEKRYDRTFVYFQGMTNASISADGEIISGLMRLNPDSENLSWVVFDVRKNKLVNTGKEMRESDAALRTNGLISLSPTGKYAAIMNDINYSILVYDVENHKLLTLESSNRSVAPDFLRIGIDEERKYVVAGDSSGKVGLWDFQGNRLVKEFPAKFDWLTNLGFLPDGKVFLLRSYSNRVWIWDPLQNQGQETEYDHTDEVWSLLFDVSVR